MTDKEWFISKWSSWWSLTRDAHELNKAFESELTALSLPAPTQDGTAEEELRRATGYYLEPYDLPETIETADAIKAIESYAAPLRAEIERLKLEEITNSTDLQTQYDRIKYLHSELTAANQRVKDLEDTILWALGYIGSFPERKEGQGLYWWRTELDRRSNIKPK